MRVSCGMLARPGTVTHLEKQTQLESSVMLQMMFPLQLLIQMSHARWEMPFRHVIHHLCRHCRPVPVCWTLIVRGAQSREEGSSEVGENG